MKIKTNTKAKSVNGVKKLVKKEFEKYIQIQVIAENFHTTTDSYGNKRFGYIVCDESKSLLTEEMKAHTTTDKEGNLRVWTDSEVNKNCLLQFGPKRYQYKDNEGNIVIGYTKPKFFNVKQTFSDEEKAEYKAEQRRKQLAVAKQKLQELEEFKDFLSSEEYSAKKSEILASVGLGK